MPESGGTERAQAIAAFIDRAGWRGAKLEPLAGDASFRKYYRLIHEQVPGRPAAVIMDAPPPKEDVRPFLAVARHLRKMGYSAPAILADDVESGLLLIEDLGDDTFTRVLEAGGDEPALYRLATDLLIDLHRRRDASSLRLPPYDDERLLQEATLLTDWYLPAVNGAPTPAAVRSEFVRRWSAVFALAREVPTTLVLRDFHVDNLMHLPERAGVARCGLLDFQDAVIGPVAYDLVSLTEDARRDVKPELARALVERYLAAFPALDAAKFKASYAILGAQRSTKIVGIFTRLMVRDGKPQYLPHIPRVWRWLEGDLAHPALAAVRAWFDENVPRAKRAVPGGAR